MLYFKPPGARGQAFHQDNQYIRKYPVIAAWAALDDCDEANGQMVVIPGSQKEGMQVFAGIDPGARLIVAEAVWQYSHHILHGLITHAGPILTVANWSGVQ